MAQLSSHFEKASYLIHSIWNLISYLLHSIWNFPNFTISSMPTDGLGTLCALVSAWTTMAKFVFQFHNNGSMQMGHNSIANILELCNFCIKPSIWQWHSNWYPTGIIYQGPVTHTCVSQLGFQVNVHTLWLRTNLYPGLFAKENEVATWLGDFLWFITALPTNGSAINRFQYTRPYQNDQCHGIFWNMIHFVIIHRASYSCEGKKISSHCITAIVYFQLLFHTVHNLTLCMYIYLHGELAGKMYIGVISYQNNAF